ncbi:hypothetical protein Sango_3101100 [Sesamum angolense]|uniref:DUF4283 domain-containing protein n=1 Tax=Sesamum angolense TaxID=2727404 RepID=A0AAE1T9L8_9LAMI|nr:hypothetical protein Sango_3101100 [Sesamum angolense]
MAALEDLKSRWIAKFGDDFNSSVNGGLKPVALRQATPFPRPPMRLPRRAQRIITLETLAPPSRVFDDCARAAPLVGAAANPTASETRLNVGIEKWESFKTVSVTPVGAVVPMVSVLTAAEPRTGHVDETVAVEQPESIIAMAADREGVLLSSGSPAILELPRRSIAETVPAAGVHSLMRRPGFLSENVVLCESEYSKMGNCVKTITATSNGFYFFQFETEIAMEEVIEGGPWLFQGQLIVLQRWESGMVLRKHKHTQVPMWIRLRHLPVEFWTNEGLSTVASGVGWPLYQDTTLGHARDWISLVYV